MAVQAVIKRQVAWVNGPVNAQIDANNPLSGSLVGAWPLINFDLRNVAYGTGFSAQSEELNQFLVPTGNGISYRGGRKQNLVPELAGTSDYFDGGLIDMSGWTAFTVSIWVKFDSSGTDEHSVMSNFSAPGGSTAGFRLALEPFSTADTIDFLVIEEANATRTGHTNKGSVPVDEWFHLVAVYDPNGASELRTYVNGLESGTATAVSGVLDSTTSTNNLFFGEANHTANDSLTGGLSNAYLWRNRALLDIDVMRLYKNEWGLYAPRTQIIPGGTIDAITGQPISSFTPAEQLSVRSRYM